ncbi:developmentally-regulated internal PM-anchored protein [Acrasis kona]|uniref:Developmentally-regulated internal PM-anchored protein n=1 Tax=Acrasis kona TaxID=1008807 RepID=A0AAW2YX31_9EUKA
MLTRTITTVLSLVILMLVAPSLAVDNRVSHKTQLAELERCIDLVLQEASLKHSNPVHFESLSSVKIVGASYNLNLIVSQQTMGEYQIESVVKKVNNNLEITFIKEISSTPSDSRKDLTEDTKRVLSFAVGFLSSKYKDEMVLSKFISSDQQQSEKVINYHLTFEVEGLKQGYIRVEATVQQSLDESLKVVSLTEEHLE